MKDLPVTPDHPAAGTTTHTIATDPERPLVVVAVGTDHHRFDRLVQWMDEWAARNPGVQVVIQRGSVTSTDHAESCELIPHPELCRLFGAASAVVAHGGPSTIMDARAAGRVPIVMPRDPARGEHVDDHQLRFAHHLAAEGLARLVTEPADLAPLLAEAVEQPDTFAVPSADGAAPGVIAFGQVLDDLLDIYTPVSPSRRKEGR